MTKAQYANSRNTGSTLPFHSPWNSASLRSAGVSPASAMSINGSRKPDSSTPQASAFARRRRPDAVLGDRTGANDASGRRLARHSLEQAQRAHEVDFEASYQAEIGAAARPYRPPGGRQAGQVEHDIRSRGAHARVHRVLRTEIDMDQMWRRAHVHDPIDGTLRADGEGRAAPGCRQSPREV